MERILRQFSHLTNEQFGMLVKLAFEYVDKGTYESEYVSENMKAFFACHVEPLLEKMMKDRKRKRGI